MILTFFLLEALKKPEQQSRVKENKYSNECQGK